MPAVFLFGGALRATRVQRTRSLVAAVLLSAFACLPTSGARGSDHLDSPSVVADNRADIGDLYAWMDPDGVHLNLVMTLVSHGFSDRLDYVFHVDSGKGVGPARATTRITCRFASARRVDCRAEGIRPGQGGRRADTDTGNGTRTAASSGTDPDTGIDLDIEHASGDPSGDEGLWSTGRRLRVFAGLRDDPFANNVKGTRAAYLVADEALKAGADRDAAGCPRFDAATSRAILAEWRQTDGGPGRNFLEGWTSAALVVQIERSAVDRGGPLLAVWAATVAEDRQVDRAGRTLTGNALLGNFDDAVTRDRLKERYNAATPATAADFAPEIAKALGLYDAFDGRCGDQWLAVPDASGPERYGPLARLLADDRLWIDSRSTRCAQPFAVELAHVDGRREYGGDCGGRRPDLDAVDVYRSLLVDGRTDSIDDGVAMDDASHPVDRFPFLAAPASDGYPEWTR